MSDSRNDNTPDSWPEATVAGCTSASGATQIVCGKGVRGLFSVSVGISLAEGVTHQQVLEGGSDGIDHFDQNEQQEGKQRTLEHEGLRRWLVGNGRILLILLIPTEKGIIETPELGPALKSIG